MNSFRRAGRASAPRRSGDPALGAVKALWLLAAAAALASPALATSNPEPPARTSPAVIGGLANNPIRFELAESKGAAPSFLARGLDYQFWLRPTEADIVVRKIRRSEEGAPGRGQVSLPEESALRRVRMRFEGANPDALMQGLEEAPGKVNYLVGDDPAKWRVGATSFGKVAVKRLYPAIDLVYYGNQRQLEYDFIVPPGADPSTIAIRFEGADSVSIGRDGQLVLGIGSEEISHPRPTFYQTIDGVRKLVAGGYRLIAPSTIGFAPGAYDPRQTLVIDPILSYSSFFGGNSGDLALSVKVDNAGFVYVAGETLSTDFPLTVTGFDTSFGGGKINGDAFVAKFTPSVSALVYFTYLGGSGNDGALDLAVDAAGHAHVCGFTDSPDFPTRNALYPKIHGKQTPNGIYQADAFLAELDATGAALVYSTYFGGTNAERADALAIDPAGAAYITGASYSGDLPLVNPLPGQTNLHGPYDAFVAKFGSGGSPLIYSTYLGGTNADEGQGIAADAAGNAFITGFTTSTNFPITPGAYRSELNGYAKLTPLFEAFVTKIAPQGGELAYSTFLGGTNSDSGFRIAVDGDGNAYVTGTSPSLDFPNTATNLGLAVGFTNLASANNDAFLAKFGPDGSLAWSTRFGGEYSDVGWDVALDGEGNPFIVGTTGSTNFPTVNAGGFPIPEKITWAVESVFVMGFKKDASAMIYSLTLGGFKRDGGFGIAVDPAGNAYIVGKTSSTNFPVAKALLSSLDGTNDAFIAKIALEPVLRTARAGDSLQLKWRAFSPEYSLESGANSAAGVWSPVPQEPTVIDGWHTVTLGITNKDSFFRLRTP